MIGKVDDRNRALVDFQVRQMPNSPSASVTAWIDTAFDGHLVFPAPLIQELQLESLAETEAILADGSQVTLETFVCYLEWFGTLIPLQVVANEGKLPLLGTGLLKDHVLHVDSREQSAGDRLTLRMTGGSAAGRARRSAIMRQTPAGPLQPLDKRHSTTDRRSHL